MDLKAQRNSSAKRLAEREAAIWLVRIEDGLSGDEQKEYEAWLEASPENWAASQKTTILEDLLLAGALQGMRTPAAPVRRHSGWRRLALAGAAAVLFATGFFLYRAHWSNDQVTQEYAADAASVRKIALPDGSEIELGRNSSVRVTYTAQQRLVVLKTGNARFSVAKNPKRPFVTLAERVSVQAIGTVFNVAVAPNGVEVYVTEGKVQVKKSVEQDSPRSQVPPEEMSVEFPYLAAGEGAIIPTKTVEERQPITDHPAYQAPAPEGLEWRLFFANTRLADVVTEFNRRNHVQIVIDDRSLCEREVGGNFRADQPEAFVRLLQNGRDVAVDFHEPGRIVLRKPR